MDKLIVKRFPKGYILFNNAMQQVVTPCECYAVISHHGRNADGLEVYLLETGRLHRHMKWGIDELRELRGY